VFGVKEVEFGVKEVVFGVKEVVFGVKEVVFGVKEVVFGVKEVVFGVKEVVFGVKEVVFGVKEVVCWCAAHQLESPSVEGRYAGHLEIRISQRIATRSEEQNAVRLPRSGLPPHLPVHMEGRSAFHSRRGNYTNLRNIIVK